MAPKGSIAILKESTKFYSQLVPADPESYIRKKNKAVYFKVASVWEENELQQVLTAQQGEFHSTKFWSLPSLLSHQKNILKLQQLPENFPEWVTHVNREPLQISSLSLHHWKLKFSVTLILYKCLNLLNLLF